MTVLTVVGPALCLAGAALAAALVRDCLRRPRMPRLRYGARTAGETAVRWSWAVLLGAGFLAGVEGVALWTRTDARVLPDAAPAEAAAPGRQILRIPFYQREREVGVPPGPTGARGRDPRRATVVERIEMPWPFLLAAGCYWLLVVRWPVDRTGG